MLSVDALRDFGANVDEGMGRCMNNEAFYLRLVNMAIGDAGFGKLEAALAAHDLDAAFDAAHGLKGILANLALTPLCDVVGGMTEALRARTDKDYGPDLAKLLALRDELVALAG